MARSAALFPVNTIWSAQPFLILKLLKKYSGQMDGYALDDPCECRFLTGREELSLKHMKT